MAHEIKEGYIQIVKCVTPGCFWIKCGNCAGTCKVPESIRRKPYSGEYYPSQGVRVFVHDSDGFFYRGVVCGQRSGQSPSCKYVVLLSDTFQIKDFDRGDIYPSFDENSVDCEGFHLVSLYNALPSIPPSNFTDAIDRIDESCRKFLEKIQKWNAKNHLVEDFLKANVSLQYKNVATIDGATYGNLSFTDCDLIDHFIKLKVLAKVTSRFEKIVKVVKSPPSFFSDDVFPAIAHKFFDFKPDQVKVEHNLGKYRVYEGDRELYERMTKQFHIITFLVDPPTHNDVVLRLVNQRGLICLGTIINPKLSYCRMASNSMTEDEKQKKMLKLFFDQQENGFVTSHRKEVMYRLNLPSCFPPSSDESDQSDEESQPIHCKLEYDVDESSREFIRDGGILENVHSSHPLPNHSHPIHHFIEKSLNVLDIDKLDKWQEIYFPSLLHGKNHLIIGPKSHKMTTTLIWLLATIKHSKTNTKHPKCVIIVNNYKRAYDIATICKKLSNVKLLVSTCSVITDTQVAQAKEGCDILITSPTNWCKFTTDLNCFNHHIVDYYVFDALEKMHSCYSENLKTIFEAFEPKRKMSQIILLSNSWTSSIIGYGKCIDSLARIVIDVVQAAFCYGLKPTVVFADNWRQQLVKIIKNDKATKRLLLCENHSQVETIKEATQDLEDVLYLSEKQNRANILKCVNSWTMGEKTFLVCSDVLFQEFLFVDDVNVLVSWTLNPINWQSLIKRFKTIRGHKVEDRSKLTVYMFCSTDDLNSLLFVQEYLRPIKGCGFIGGHLDEYLKKATAFEDKKKVNESICSSIFMFGSCENYHRCSSRHCLLPSDNVIAFRTKQFLKIELVNVISVFHFTVRVTDVVSNGESPDSINQLRSNLHEIEEGLLAAYENMMEDGLRAKVRVHDVVGVRTYVNKDLILRRSRVLKIEEENGAIYYEIGIMDYNEPNRRVRRQDIFPISKEIVSFPCDLIDVYICGLLPTDFQSDWCHETSNFIVNFINYLQESTKIKYEFLAGVVELAIDRHVIVSSIYWCRQLKSSNCPSIAYGSLKECIMKTGYVRDNPQHIEQLSHFTGLPNPQVKDGRFGYREISAKSSISGFVSSFEDPSLFYVQFEHEKGAYASFEKQFDHSMKFQNNLLVVKHGELCAVNVDGNWNRAIVVSIDDKNDSTRYEHRQSTRPTLESIEINVLCVDFGDVRVMKTSELFCLPESSCNVPFFAVECKLVGIKPIKGDNWCENAVEQFTEFVRNDEEMVSLYTNFFGVADENAEQKYYRYQVSLSLTEAASSPVINQQLVKNGVAIWDESTVDLLIHRKINSDAFKHVHD